MWRLVTPHHSSPSRAQEGHRSRAPRSVQRAWGQAGWEESQVRERQGRDKHQTGGEARGKTWGSGQTLLLCFNKQSSTLPEWNRLRNLGNGHSRPRLQCNRPMWRNPQVHAHTSNRTKSLISNSAHSHSNSAFPRLASFLS